MFATPDQSVWHLTTFSRDWHCFDQSDQKYRFIYIPTDFFYMPTDSQMTALKLQIDCFLLGSN